MALAGRSPSVIVTGRECGLLPADLGRFRDGAGVENESDTAMAIDPGTHRRRSIRGALAAALKSLRGPIWPAPVPTIEHEAHECPLCHAHFLYPADRGTADDAHRWVRSRCGECGTWSEIVITNTQAARLERELDRQTAAIQDAAARMEAARMAAQADAFIHALRRDLIDAADFA